MNIVFEKLDKLRKLRLDIASMQREVQDLHEYIKNNCKHPDYAWHNKSEYFAGDYLDKSYTTKWEECSICGAKRNEKNVLGTYA